MAADPRQFRYGPDALRWYVALFVIGTAIVLAGFFIGTALQPTPATSQIGTRGDLVEARTGDGTWLVGVLVSDSADFVRLSDPAQVIDVGTSGSDGQFRVKLLSDQPTTVNGDVLVAREQLAFFGEVAKGSQLEAAYAEVLTEALGTPSPAPAPT